MQQEQQQVITTAEGYFFPPPINEFNKNYHQQLSSADNPVYQATKSYISFNELYRLDNSNAEYECQMVTEELKETLRVLNKTIYNKMLGYLASLSGQAPLENIKTPDADIRQDIFKFMQICESVKKFETKRNICSIMAKQTEMIRARTAEINQNLDEVKEIFHNAANAVKSAMKPQ